MEDISVYGGYVLCGLSDPPDDFDSHQRLSSEMGVLCFSFPAAEMLDSSGDRRSRRLRDFGRHSPVCREARDPLWQENRGSVHLKP